jgi:hypothetical protein
MHVCFRLQLIQLILVATRVCAEIERDDILFQHHEAILASSLNDALSPAIQKPAQLAAMHQISKPNAGGRVLPSSVSAISNFILYHDLFHFTASTASCFACTPIPTSKSSSSSPPNSRRRATRAHLHLSPGGLSTGSICSMHQAAVPAFHPASRR